MAMQAATTMCVGAKQLHPSSSARCSCRQLLRPYGIHCGTAIERRALAIDKAPPQTSILHRRARHIQDLVLTIRLRPVEDCQPLQPGRVEGVDRQLVQLKLPALVYQAVRGKEPSMQNFIVESIKRALKVEGE